MALQRRLVIYQVGERDVPALDEHLRTRGFQVYRVAGEAEALDVVRFSQPDGLLLVGPLDTPCAARLVEANTSGRVLLGLLWTGASSDRVADLLNVGLDLVVTSYHPDALAAQLQAYLRRIGRDRAAATVIELDYLRIDLQGQTVTVDGRSVPLTPTEFGVLRTLAERPGTVLPSGEIVQQAMGARIPEGQAQDLLKVHIHRLRHKLEHDPNNPRFIRTIRGRGYMYAFERREKDRGPSS